MAFFVPETHDFSAQSSQLVESLKVPSMNISSDDIKVGDKAVIAITLPEDAEGVCTVFVDGQSISSDNIRDGDCLIEVENLTAGIHPLIVTYGGDAHYRSATVTGTIEATKVECGLSIDTHGFDGNFEYYDITVVFPGDASGTISLLLDDNLFAESEISSADNGRKVFSIPDSLLSGGQHDVEAVYSGDGKYLEARETDSFYVSDVPASIEVISSADNISVGGSVIYTVRLPEDCTGSVSIEIEGTSITYTKEISEGGVQFSIPGDADLVPQASRQSFIDLFSETGSFRFTFTYNGDDKYAPAYTDIMLSVL